jgi:hypothetical protein
MEPHAEREVRLGTLGVREYLPARVERDPIVTPRLFDAEPQHRYAGILFIEKEGFGSAACAMAAGSMSRLAFEATLNPTIDWHRSVAPLDRPRRRAAREHELHVARGGRGGRQRRGRPHRDHRGAGVH